MGIQILINTKTAQFCSMMPNIPPTMERVIPVTVIKSKDFSEHGILIKSKKTGIYAFWCAGAIQSIDQNAAKDAENKAKGI